MSKPLLFECCKNSTSSLSQFPLLLAVIPPPTYQMMNSMHKTECLAYVMARSMVVGMNTPFVNHCIMCFKSLCCKEWCLSKANDAFIEVQEDMKLCNH